MAATPRRPKPQPEARGPKSDKLWANAVRLAVMRETTDPDGRKTNYLNRIAQKLVEQAAEGDSASMREVGDRLDGKPMQAIEATGNLTITLAAGDTRFG